MDARIRAVPCGRLRAIRIAAVVAPLVLWIVIANMFTGPPRVHNAASAEARYEWCANDALQNKPIQNFDQYLGACIREWQNSRHANLTAVDLAMVAEQRETALNVATLARMDPTYDYRNEARIVWRAMKNGAGR